VREERRRREEKRGEEKRREGYKGELEIALILPL
jgi:hypothetical protein